MSENLFSYWTPQLDNELLLSHSRHTKNVYLDAYSGCHNTEVFLFQVATATLEMTSEVCPEAMFVC
jgi:hypothetical protein